jgi:hypothetical protein
MARAIETQTAMLLRFPPTVFDLDNEEVYPYSMITKFLGVPTCLTLRDIQTLSGVIPQGTWIHPEEALVNQIAQHFDEGAIRASLVGSMGTFAELRPVAQYEGSEMDLDPEAVARYLAKAPAVTPHGLVHDNKNPDKLISPGTYRALYRERLP